MQVPVTIVSKEEIVSNVLMPYVEAFANDNSFDSLGLHLRWDFYDNMAFKFEYTHVDPKIKSRGNGNLISFGVDFVF